MINGFIDRVSSAGQLKDALDVGSQRLRGIADRVSKASLQNQDGFALPGEASGQPNSAGPDGSAGASGVDLESEMTDLADAQIRFEATSKLLSKAYEQVRSSLQDK